MPHSRAVCLGDIGKAVEIQVIAGMRADKVAASLAQHGMERRGVLHVLLEELVLEFGHVDIQALCSTRSVLR